MMHWVVNHSFLAMLPTYLSVNPFTPTLSWLTSMYLFASCFAWLVADSQVGEFVFNLESYVYKDKRGMYRTTF